MRASINPKPAKGDREGLTLLPSAPQYEDLIQLFEKLPEEQTFVAVCDALDYQLARGLPLSTHLPRRGVPDNQFPANGLLGNSACIRPHTYAVPGLLETSVRCGEGPGGGVGGWEGEAMCSAGLWG